MPQFLLDTNLLSEQRKPRPDAGVLQWFSNQTIASSLISVVTIAEIEQGILLLGNTKRAKAYRAWLANLEQDFFGCIVPFDREVASAWAELTSKAIHLGSTLSYADSLIAATAIVHQVTVVTRNTDDFKTFVPVLNPWTEPLN
jgi:toxin FitB